MSLLCVSCSQSTHINDPLIHRLNNRGAVVLSPDNPFLAGNLLIARESEKSPEMKGFIEHRGNPAALEVTKESFAPLYLNLFYPERREYYTFEELDKGWIISGPFRLQSDKFKELSQLTQRTEAASNNAAAPATTAAPQLAGKTPAAIQPLLAGTSAPSAADHPDSVKSGFQSPPVPAAQKTAGTTPLNPMSPQLIQLIEKAPAEQAEITPKGDLVHYVTMNGETLSLLARWYTGDRDNAARLARINSLARPDALTVGDTIIVPSYLLRNNKRLTQPSLQALQQLVANGQ